GSAQERERPRFEEPATVAGKGTGGSRKEVGRPDLALERGEKQALERAEAEKRTRRASHRTRQRAAPGRISARRRIGLWADSRTREKADRDRGQGRRRRDAGRGGHRQSHRASGFALDRRAGRQDARGRKRKIASDGREPQQARD